MKEIGIDDWLIGAILELYGYFRKRYASQVSPAVEEVTSIRPASFDQFARDYAESFR